MIILLKRFPYRPCVADEVEADGEVDELADEPVDEPDAPAVVEPAAPWDRRL
jgi:hypothetical protein